MIKSIVGKLLLIMVFIGSVAQPGFAGDSKLELKKLGRFLKSKTLQCKPLDGRKPHDARYRGDEGYFSLSVEKKDQTIELRVFDHGGYGYGFSNGEFRDLAFEGTRFYLSVGDDGFQTLVFDFDDLGSLSELPDRCAPAILLNAYDSIYHAEASIDLVCCLK